MTSDTTATADGVSVALELLLEGAKSEALQNPEGAILLYKKTIEAAFECQSSAVEETLRLQEQAIYGLASLYVEQHRPTELRNLVLECKPFFAVLPKARTAKIVRTLIDLVSRIAKTEDLQVDLCLECIAWCSAEKRTFLRHRIETRLALLYLQQGKLQLGLELVERLLKEVKKLDDKLLLVEIHLIECKLYFTVKNYAKAKAALTAARTNANAIHCPPLLQGDIDLQAGILHAQEKDYKTSFSYFFEAFEAFTSASSALHLGHLSGEDRRALQSLKYMMLAKIMCGQPDEVGCIISGKYGLKFAGDIELEALKAVAKCHKERSLKMFEATLEKYKPQLQTDTTIQHHTSDLYETLLEQNLLRILEPFSRVELVHVAKLIDLPLTNVQAKLSEMILDGKLQGTLDQGVGLLVLFDTPPPTSTYEDVLATLKNMASVVDTLYEKAQQAM